MSRAELKQKIFHVQFYRFKNLSYNCQKTNFQYSYFCVTKKPWCNGQCGRYLVVLHFFSYIVSVIAMMNFHFSLEKLIPKAFSRSTNVIPVESFHSCPSREKISFIIHNRNHQQAFCARGVDVINHAGQVNNIRKEEGNSSFSFVEVERLKISCKFMEVQYVFICTYIL